MDRKSYTFQSSQDYVSSPVLCLIIAERNLDMPQNQIVVLYIDDSTNLAQGRREGKYMEVLVRHLQSRGQEVSL